MQFVDLAAQQKHLRSEIEAGIAAVLDHGRYIMGPEVAELEADLAAFVGDGEVVTCASGTDALVMALLTRTAGPGDAVFVPSFTFAATAEAVALLGATPVFVDIDPGSFNLDPEALVAAIEGLDSDLRPAGVIPVDLFGLPADYVALQAVADRYGLWIVADAAQSFGALVEGVRVGRFAPLTTTSFFPAKPLGCYGDGGAIVALDPEDAKILRSIRVHGSGNDKYDNVRLGINGRLDTLQAAILLPKLRVFAEELDARQRVAERYRQGLEGTVICPAIPERTRSAWAQYTVQVANRDAVVAALVDRSIPYALYYPVPLHRQRAYARFPVGAAGMAATDYAASSVLSLPMHPYLTPADQDLVIDAVRLAAGIPR